MKHFLLTITLFITGLVSFAQPDPEARQQRIKALYVAYISQELKLTEDEAQKFWPVHSEFDKEIRAVKHDLDELPRQQAVLNIKKKYQDRFVKILGLDRTNAFYRADVEFRRRLVDRLRNMRENKGKQRPPKDKD